MDFGKVGRGQLPQINFELPPDDVLSANFLVRLKSERHSQTNRVFIGAPAWGARDWVGRLYPEGAKPAHFLKYYAEKFESIELNTSHYRIPSAEQVMKWRDQVSQGFQFCAKVVQSISHEKTGLLDPKLSADWFQFLEQLGENRGPCFLQFPPHFDYGSKAVLFQFLKLWPSEFELCLEFRHPSWFHDHKILPALVEYLQSRRIGLMITDVAGRRDVLHTSISTPFTMIRFVGNDLHETDVTRLTQWTERLVSWKNQGLEQIYFFIHQPDDIKTPEMRDLVMKKFSDARLI